MKDVGSFLELFEGTHCKAISAIAGGGPLVPPEFPTAGQAVRLYAVDARMSHSEAVKAALVFCEHCDRQWNARSSGALDLEVDTVEAVP